MGDLQRHGRQTPPVSICDGATLAVVTRFLAHKYVHMYEYIFYADMEYLPFCDFCLFIYSVWSIGSQWRPRGEAQNIGVFFNVYCK